MIKYLTSFALLVIVATTSIAQNQKCDTVVLSLYNNNQRYMLYPMPDTQSDKLNIDVTALQSGAYSVSLVSGNMREVK